MEHEVDDAAHQGLQVNRDSPVPGLNLAGINDPGPKADADDDVSNNQHSPT